MIRSKFTILAKTITIDSLTNQLSLLNVIEELQAPETPAILGDSSIAILFERDEFKDPNVVPAKVRVYLNETKLGEQNFNIDFQKMRRNRLVLNVPELMLKEFGILKFDFLVKNKTIGSYDVAVLKTVQLQDKEKSPKSK